MSGLLAQVAEEQARPLPREGLDAVVAALWPGGTVTSVERLVGGLGAGMHRLEVRDAGGRPDAVILRLFLAAYDHGPALAVREHATLAALASAGAPAPAPRWLDASGEVLGRPALAMEVVPGRPLVCERPPDVVSLARALAEVHRTRAGAFPHLPPPRSLGAQVASCLPTEERPVEGFVDTPALWRTIDRWTATSTPATACLVHGDFHAGNVLSDGRRVTAVDWTWACLGDPGRDLGYCRYDLAIANGPAAADAFTAAYLEAGGVAVPSPYWDLVAVATSLPTPGDWLRGFVELGRDDCTVEGFETAGRAFLTATMAALR